MPELRPGDIVVIDNLSSHKGPAVRGMIEAAEARPLYLPPYSPDFNPVENLFAKLKALLRRETPRTLDTLWSTIGRILHLVTPRECQNMFAPADIPSTPLLSRSRAGASGVGHEDRDCPLKLVHDTPLFASKNPWVSK